MSALPARSIAGIALVVFAVGATAVGVYRQARRSAPEADARAQPVAEAEPSDAALLPEPVTVYYFHGDTRCATCRAIEEQTARVLQERFAEELATEKLRFERVNFDEEANRHFQDDYDLAFGSVVVQGNGKDRPWENLANVWTLIHDDTTAFDAYIVEHVRRMLEPVG